MDAAQLEEVLEALRRSRGETSYIEVKAAATDLPDNVHETLSAFANTGGGSILLGVSEDRGGFRVSGVEDPTRVANQLRDLCSHMVPVLRPRVDRIAHPDGVVLAIEVTPIDRRQRPCFLESAGAFGGSFVRMDEGDVQLLDGEVAALLAERSTEDASRNPAPDGTTLDPDAVSAFVASVRASSPRWQTVPEDELLRSRQVVTDGQPTIAGSMALSFDPDRTIPAARIAYRVEPGAGAPAGTRFSGDSISGPIGVLMDEVLEHLRNDLGRLVSTEQGTEDVYEVPIRGLREIISNALVHRSYTEGQLNKAALVHLTERAVSVVSPGACYVDVETLGLSALASVRNNALVNICQRITTPSGQRICEAQVTGVRFADQVSREAGVAPPLFIDRPLELEVVLLRGRLDLAEAYARLPVDADPLDRRLLAWAIQAEELRDGGRHLHESALLTGVMAARLLAPSTVEEGLTRLARLEERGFLSKQRLGRRTVWTPTGHGRPVVRDGGKTTKFERAGLVTMAVHRLGGEATPAQIAEALGLGSTRTRSQWIGDAGDAELVEEIGKSTFDPNKVVRLTKAGRAHAAAAERRGGQP